MVILKNDISAPSSSAVWAIKPDGSLQTLYENGADTLHLAASHIKLMLAEQAASMIEKGQLDLNDILEVTSGFPLADDPSDAGFPAPLEQGHTSTVRDSLERMLKYSSNTHTNLLIHAMYPQHFEEAKVLHPNDTVKAEQYAFDQITNDLKGAGYHNTSLQNFLNVREGHHSERSLTQSHKNQTTVADVGLAMQRLWNSTTAGADIARNALKHAKEKLGNDSLGEKVSGTSKIMGHAGFYQRNGITYISAGFIDRSGGGKLETFRPFYDEAQTIIQQDTTNRQKIAHATPSSAPEKEKTAESITPDTTTQVKPETTSGTNHIMQLAGISRQFLGNLWSMISPLIASFFSMFNGGDHIASSGEAPTTQQTAIPSGQASQSQNLLAQNTIGAVPDLSATNVTHSTSPYEITHGNVPGKPTGHQVARHS